MKQTEDEVIQHLIIYLEESGWEDSILNNFYKLHTDRK